MNSIKSIFLVIVLIFALFTTMFLTVEAETLPFSDNFANLSSWTIVDGTWNIISGVGVQGSSPSGEALMWAGSKSWSNYQISAPVTISAGGEGNIVFRFGDSNNFYWAGMGDWQHQYSISKNFNGVTSEIVGSGIEQSNGAGTYTLMVVVQGNTIKLYVNNVQVLTTTDNTFTFGSVGLRTFASIMQVKSINVLPLSAPPLTVTIAPPGSFLMDVGQSKTFAANVSGGSGTIHYQWFNYSSVVATDTSSYTYTASGTSASITCKATDSASTPVSSTSNTVTISVAPTPTVVVSPSGSFLMDVGQFKTFTAIPAGGSGIIHFQWYVNGGTVGTDSSSYTYSASGSSASIMCKVTDSASSPVTSLASNAATISVAPMPTVTITSSDVGQSKLLTAVVSGGSGIIHYQWLVGTTVVGTDSSSYTYTASGTSASITCKVTDSASTPATSTSNAVTITPLILTVSVSPGSASLIVGQSKTFVATASGGSGSYTSYQWYVNEVAQNGQSAQTFNFSPTSSGSYSITATVIDSSGKTSAQSSPAGTANVDPTPAPVTPVPVTPKPVTPVPVTPKPVTPVPVTPKPVTPVPVTPKPTKTPTPPPFPLYYVAAVVSVLGGIFGAAFAFKKRKKNSPTLMVPIKPVTPPAPPTSPPTQLRLSADPLSIVADGVSKSALSLQLLDRVGKPAAATADLVVKMFASKGKLALSTLTVGKGTSVASTFITATEPGSALVSAKSKGLVDGEVKLSFMVSQPSQLRLSADPLSIVADGVSKSALSLQLLDREGKPAAATADLVVKMFASKGKLAQPTVTILMGASVAKTFITASTEKGSVIVSADCVGLSKVEVALNFKEEEQHCLYCGAVTPSMYEPCPECGRVPP